MSWEESLRAVLTDYAAAEYCWGHRDCVKFVNAYVLARTGVDHASKFEYDSEFSALKLMSQHGGVEGLIESCLGESSSGAKAGDIVVCHAENFHIPGVYNGSFVWAFAKERGLCRLTLPSVICAWEV